jgi:hypothetical protein
MNRSGAPDLVEQIDQSLQHQHTMSALPEAKRQAEAHRAGPHDDHGL